jgi:hypothetical protein
MKISILFPAGLYIYGPFPTVGGMSRPRVVDLTGAPAGGVVICAETGDDCKRLAHALGVVFRHAGGTVCSDPAQWLTNSEIIHAARMAGCVVTAPEIAPAAEIVWHNDPTTDIAMC